MVNKLNLKENNPSFLESNQDDLSIRDLLKHMQDLRRPIESMWQDCYKYTESNNSKTNFRNKGVFDATAIDAVELLASHLMAELTPPWSPWFYFVTGYEINSVVKEELIYELDYCTRHVKSVLEISNFYTELHQAYIDLIIGGTACILLEESDIENMADIHFKALPLRSIYLSEDNQGSLSTLVWQQSISAETWKKRFVVEIPKDTNNNDCKNNIPIINLYHKKTDSKGYWHDTYYLNDSGEEQRIARISYDFAPFLAFRWLKVAGETYGRSPVMKALPDIKTANKVVELSLKNASIAVSGIWQADDDGVINPSTIQLKPGAIIPKALGSSGLTPLKPPGRFDLSQILLDSLHQRIRRSLLVDRMSSVATQQQTATEVLERAKDISHVLGATYGRLFSECLSPLIHRINLLLAKKGVFPQLPIDGKKVAIKFLSPLNFANQGRAISPVINYLRTMSSIHPRFIDSLNIADINLWVAKNLDLPSDFQKLINNIIKPDLLSTLTKPNL